MPPIVTRRELDLKSTLYSREWDVERGVGCHLMSVIRRISLAAKWSKQQNSFSEDQLEKFRLSGFLWEHVMSEDDRLEHAMSEEFLRAESRYRTDVTFYHERFYCIQCDDVMEGGEFGGEHCKELGHTGIFFNLDYLNDRRRRVGEIKWTRKSSKNCSETSLDVREWIAQNMFYCWGVGWLGGEFRTCWENGDYSYPMIPRMYEFDVDYEQGELEKMKSLIVSTARSLEWV